MLDTNKINTFSLLLNFTKFIRFNFQLDYAYIPFISALFFDTSACLKLMKFC